MRTIVRFSQKKAPKSGKNPSAAGYQRRGLGPENPNKSRPRGPKPEPEPRPRVPNPEQKKGPSPEEPDPDGPDVLLPIGIR